MPYLDQEWVEVRECTLIEHLCIRPSGAGDVGKRSQRVERRAKQPSPSQDQGSNGELGDPLCLPLLGAPKAPMPQPGESH